MLRMQRIELPRKWFYWNNAVSSLIHLKFEIQYKTDEYTDQARIFGIFYIEICSFFVCFYAEICNFSTRFLFFLYRFSSHPEYLHPQNWFVLIKKRDTGFNAIYIFFSTANGNATSGAIGGFSIQHWPLIFD